MTTKLVIVLLLSALLPATAVHAQSRFFAGGAAGIATLSADGQTSITSDSVAFSTYRPFNGAALNLFAGTHVNDFVSLQGNYIWNRNELTVTSSLATPGSLAVREEKRGSAQNSAIVDFLLYFRNRESWARPYLSAGSGVVHFKSNQKELLNSRGSPPQIEPEFTSTALALRVAVGIDVLIGRGLAVRYSFSETIRGNPVSRRLSPPGERNLANFQNLFGIVKYF
jgi:hypothetical protein